MGLCFKLFLVGFLSLYSGFFLSFYIYLIIVVWSLDILEVGVGNGAPHSYPIYKFLPPENLKSVSSGLGVSPVSVVGL